MDTLTQVRQRRAPVTITEELTAKVLTLYKSGTQWSGIRRALGVTNGVIRKVLQAHKEGGAELEARQTRGSQKTTDNAFLVVEPQPLQFLDTSRVSPSAVDRRPQMSIEDIEDIREAYLDGVSVQEIAKTFERSIPTIYRAINASHPLCKGLPPLKR